MTEGLLIALAFGLVSGLTLRAFRRWLTGPERFAWVRPAVMPFALAILGGPLVGWRGGAMFLVIAVAAATSAALYDRWRDRVEDARPPASRGYELPTSHCAGDLMPPR